ncbi:hypothetical protein CO615_06700 [Lysobacteraceae bacterium NML75-0749]|nr:hypothetical protein CO615_06700 [Xanthomonadaceae bacterium NML75-0749]
MKRNQVRALLVERGMSYRKWAIAHGYEPRMVVYAVNTYAGRSRLPKGRLTFKILKDLSLSLGQEIAPGVLEEAA